MIPPRRLEGLLEQARTFQRIACPYYNSRTPQSLYSDPQCDKSQFPSLATHILTMHDDEVWHLAWSHDGQHLASASNDRSAIIWHIGVSGRFPWMTSFD
jgi:WD repeat-containing protein 26